MSVKPVISCSVAAAMSGSIRLFVTAPLIEGARVPATASQAHYLGAVMRRRSGDRVKLFNGMEGEWCAEIASLGRDHASFTVLDLVRPQSTEAELALLFGLLKRDATDLVVRQATELGVTMIQPILTERTNTARVNLGRLASIAEEAAEQCERLTVPVLRPPVPLAAALAERPAGEILAVAAERSAASWPSRPADALLVGPEGGFTPAELDGLRRHPFVVEISLGPRILRAETAVAAGLALLQAQRHPT
jgi:16S rRNA (uracil1498-N3)-methyltransferase